MKAYAIEIPPRTKRTHHRILAQMMLRLMQHVLQHIGVRRAEARKALDKGTVAEMHEATRNLQPWLS